MIKKIIIVLCIALMAFTSCSKGADSACMTEMDALMNEKKGDELLEGLVALDQKYKDVLALKINISGMLLMKNEYQTAGDYLKAGLPLVKKSKNDGEKYVFYTNMAQYCFKSKDPSKCIEYAKMALDINKDDPLGTKLTMAKAYSNLEDAASALKILRDEWAVSHEKFAEEDMACLLYLLGMEADCADNMAIVVSIYDEFLIRRPNTKRMGLQQASVLEEAGYMLSALVASFSELDRCRFVNELTDESVLDTIAKFAVHFDVKSPNSKLLDGFRAYMREDFDTADAIFASITPEVPLNFYSYLQMASKANSKNTSKDVCSMFAELEPQFPLFQGYYYYLWKAYKKNGTLSKEKQRVLEQCILSNPVSRFSAETRKELGLLYGLKNGENILLKDELMVYYMRVKDGGESPEILEPLAKLMEMEDNPFKADGAIVLEEAKKIPAVAEWALKRLGR